MPRCAADGRVAREDPAATSVRDVDRVGQRRVVHVVLARDREDPEMHVARAEGRELEAVELHHASDVERARVVPGALLLRGDGVGGDRECANRGHRGCSLGSGSGAESA
jgi:hypothetical protein